MLTCLAEHCKHNAQRHTVTIPAGCALCLCQADVANAAAIKYKQGWFLQDLDPQLAHLNFVCKPSAAAWASVWHHMQGRCQFAPLSSSLSSTVQLCSPHAACKLLLHAHQSTATPACDAVCAPARREASSAQWSLWPCRMHKTSFAIAMCLSGRSEPRQVKAFDSQVQCSVTALLEYNNRKQQYHDKATVDMHQLINFVLYCLSIFPAKLVNSACVSRVMTNDA